MTAIVFVAAGDITWGSSRMRAWWVADKMGAVCVQYGDTVPPADAYIWQKYVDLEVIRAMPDSAHWWDICDPMWWFSPGETRKLLSCVNGVVCSTSALADDLRNFAGSGCPPVHVIPDRLDMAHFPIIRRPHQTNSIRFIWYGIANNRTTLTPALINLARLHANGYSVELTIMDEKPDLPIGKFDFPIYYTRWALGKENAVIAAHDIALLPPYPGEWGAVKSNNKQVTAWACNVPTVDGLNYKILEAAIEPILSGREVYVPNVAKKYDVSLSAWEWEQICHS
jgi:hypothetical protein